MPYKLSLTGRQPRELERTKALSYSVLNLNALTQLAIYGKLMGVDLWNYLSKDGRSLKIAFAFLGKFTEGGEPWPYEQISGMEESKKDYARLRSKAIKVFGPNALDMK